MHYKWIHAESRGTQDGITTDLSKKGHELRSLEEENRRILGFRVCVLFGVFYKRPPPLMTTRLRLFLLWSLKMNVAS